MMIGLHVGEAIDLSLVNCPWLPEGSCPETRASLGRTQDALHLRFLVREAEPRITCRRMNDPVYTDSCVEFFVQPLGQPGTPYLNFEMNAAGTLLLGKGVERNGRTLLQPEDVGDIRILSASSVDASGNPWWEIRLTVPHRWLEAQVPGFQAESGACLRLNLYKCGDATWVPHYGSWNPMTSSEPDFHRPEDFGTLALL